MAGKESEGVRALMWIIVILMVAMVVTATIIGVHHLSPSSAAGRSLAGLSTAMIAVCVLTIGMHVLTSSHPLYEIWILGAAGLLEGSMGLRGASLQVLCIGSIVLTIAAVFGWDEWKNRRRLP